MHLFFSGFSTLSLVLLVVGIALLVLEMFHPGFGVPGVLGILVLVLDIFVSARTFREGMLLAAIAAAVVLLFLIIGARLISKGRIPKALILQQEMGSGEGFVSSEDSRALVGAVGTAITVLRPAGIADIGGQRRDVVTQGEFLPQGTALRVVEADGGRIVVRAEAEPSEAL